VREALAARKEIKEGHETAVITAFVKCLRFQIISRPNPPDAVLKSGDNLTWVEHADIYRSADEAHEEYSHVTPGETPFIHREHPILEPDQRTAQQVLVTLQDKLNKDSYAEAFNKYGKGILVLSERDPLFSESTLEEICNVVTDYVNHDPRGGRGFFKEVYLYYWDNNKRIRIFEKLITF